MQRVSEYSVYGRELQAEAKRFIELWAYKTEAGPVQGAAGQVGNEAFEELVNTVVKICLATNFKIQLEGVTRALNLFTFIFFEWAWPWKRQRESKTTLKSRSVFERGPGYHDYVQHSPSQYICVFISVLQCLMLEKVLLPQPASVASLMTDVLHV